MKKKANYNIVDLLKEKLINTVLTKDNYLMTVQSMAVLSSKSPTIKTKILNLSIDQPAKAIKVISKHLPDNPIPMNQRVFVSKVICHLLLFILNLSQFHHHSLKPLCRDLNHKTKHRR